MNGSWAGASTVVQERGPGWGQYRWWGEELVSACIYSEGQVSQAQVGMREETKMIPEQVEK